MQWSDVAEVVGSAAPVVGTLLGGPAGGAVGGLVASALGVENEPEKVKQAIEADPEAAVKLRALEREHAREMRRMTIEAETSRLAEINKTMRAEAGSDDAYVRRWRPTWGYVAALTWAGMVGGIVYAMVATPEVAAELVNAVTALTPMWGIALAVLGINVSKRSRDKQIAAGHEPRGLLDGVAELIHGKGK